jgi:hypothetical protein
MRRVLVVALAMTMSVGVASSAEGAKKKPLKATSNGWYIYDGVGTASKTPKNGTYTRCVNDPNTPPVIRLGARYSILNRSAPKGTKHILNGPGGIHIVDKTSSATPPSNRIHVFSASTAGKSSFGPGKYTYRLKVGTTTKTTESVTLVDDPNC